MRAGFRPACSTAAGTCATETWCLASRAVTSFDGSFVDCAIRSTDRRLRSNADVRNLVPECSPPLRLSIQCNHSLDRREQGAYEEKFSMRDERRDDQTNEPTNGPSHPEAADERGHRPAASHGQIVVDQVLMDKDALPGLHRAG